MSALPSEADTAEVIDFGLNSVDFGHVQNQAVPNTSFGLSSFNAGIGEIPIARDVLTWRRTL